MSGSVPPLFLYASLVLGSGINATLIYLCYLNGTSISTLKNVINLNNSGLRAPHSWYTFDNMNIKDNIPTYINTAFNLTVEYKLSEAFTHLQNIFLVYFLTFKVQRKTDHARPKDRWAV